MAEIGAVLGGQYRVLGALGRGGMATVYLAEDVASGERIALKLLHPHLAADPSARRRLVREVAAGRRLDHPGLLVARSLFEADGAVGLVLPLHPGRTLAERVAVEGRLPTAQVVRLGLRLAEALGAAHRAGVLHRDVTARNVLVDDRGTPVLTDLGLARIGEGGTARSTALLGTAGFVAPEVLAGQRADLRSDLYGLGAVLYLAATGREPFAAAHPQAALTKQLAGEVAPLETSPAWLDQLVRSLLDPDPARRPQGAAAVAAALEEGRAPEPPRAAAAPTRVTRAALPAGAYTVVVRDRAETRDTRRAKRAIRKGVARAAKAATRGGGIVQDVSRLVGQAATALQGLAGDPGPSLEARLADAVGAAAGLPEGALRRVTALERERFRLVSHVDRATAERLANDARALDLEASVHPEGAPNDPWAFLLSLWWVLIPLMWIAFPAVTVLFKSPLIVFPFVAITVVLTTVVRPWVQHHVLPTGARALPVAYTNNLAPHLADGVQAPPEPGAAAATPGGSRVEGFGARALAALDGLEGALGAVPPLVASDLRSSIADLRREVGGLASEAGRVERELAVAATSTPAAAWAEERLARLDTLARGGVAVDAAERERLSAAVAAHEAAVEAEAALEARLTADLARLLEIDATAQRLRRELALEPTERRTVEVALADLDQRARAAAAARGELG